VSILTTLQLAMPLCGLPQMAQDIGDELRERFFWRNLNIALQITGDGTTTLFALPSDWALFSPGQRLFSSIRPTLPIFGPVTNEQLAAMKASPSFPTMPVWRLVGGTMEIWPALGAGEIVTGNYYSTNWVSNAAGLVRQPGFLLDTDFSMIDEIVLRRGLIYRWKESKGLDFSTAEASYQRSLDRAAGREDAERIVSTSAKRIDLDGWFPGVITYSPP
jgi:hypothetical protein